MNSYCSILETPCAPCRLHVHLDVCLHGVDWPVISLLQRASLRRAHSLCISMHPATRLGLPQAEKLNSAQRGVFTQEEGRQCGGRPVYAKVTLGGKKTCWVWWSTGEWRLSLTEENVGPQWRQLCEGSLRVTSDALVLEEADGQWEV